MSNDKVSAASHPEDWRTAQERFDAGRAEVAAALNMTPEQVAELKNEAIVKVSQDGSLARTIEAAEIRGYACGRASTWHHVRPEARDWDEARRWAARYGYRTQVPSLPQFSLKSPLPLATHEEAEKMAQYFRDRYPGYDRFSDRYVHLGTVTGRIPREGSEPLPIEDQAPAPGPTGKQLLFALAVMALIVLLVSLPGLLGRW